MTTENFDRNFLRNVDKPVVDNMGIEPKQAYFEISALEHKLLLVEQWLVLKCNFMRQEKVFNLATMVALLADHDKLVVGKRNPCHQNHST